MSAGIDELIARLQSKRFAIDEVAGLAEEAAAALERLQRELDEARKDAERLKDAAQDHIDVLDAYPEQLVPVNRKSTSLRILREAIDAARQPQG